ncbi:hypothetical protein K438DRAFT_1961077 [Mycena galopus ATCC 62051]|nr:hypothetical protein K438DRAFT_1961077 [Mycena galopus ATCC 62051]
MPLTHPILIIPDDEDGDSDIEILAYCLRPHDADIELLPTPVITQEEQDNRRYRDHFRLAHPPRQVLSDREKLSRVIEYLNTTPALEYAETSALALIQIVRENVESDHTWPRQLKCPGRAAKIAATLRLQAFSLPHRTARYSTGHLTKSNKLLIRDVFVNGIAVTGLAGISSYPARSADVWANPSLFLG